MLGEHKNAGIIVGVFFIQKSDSAITSGNGINCLILIWARAKVRRQLLTTNYSISGQQISNGISLVKRQLKASPFGIDCLQLANRYFLTENHG